MTYKQKMNHVYALTLITKSFFCLSSFYLLCIRQNLGWLPIRHKFEGISAATCSSECKCEDIASSLHHGY